MALIKEVNRMKQLNTHLESRLGQQEKRLCLVTTELSKTWHVVGRLRRHHHQLHTHEKILKYELQQKRKLLNELKEELEYCREKLEQAREKNSQSEKDWRKLRTEFSNRKLKADISFNNSAESGYSDERPSDSESNDESEYVEPKIKSKKKIKKSFETVVDSSTDFNLAEREDPVSDMLDIAELPLDNQDNAECVLDSSISEKLPKTENCEETEDEIGDISNDLCLDEQSKLENPLNKNEHDKIKISSGQNDQTETSNIPEISTITYMKNDSFLLLQNVTEENISEIPGSSCSSNNIIEVTQTPIYNDQNNLLTRSTINDIQEEHSNKDNTDLLSKEKIYSENDIMTKKTFKESAECESTPQNSESKVDISTTTTEIEQNIVPEATNEIDFAAILENVRKQNERLQLKDKRLEKLENGCSSTLANLSNTLQSGDDMIAKLDSLHSKYEATDGNKGEGSKEDVTKEYNKTIDAEEPSSSQDTHQEARFAARDLRLKRLEEQTKSLVSKVNKTASKGVKIHYKLEELHNIYGSENSRSGTPSEDTSEDISQNDDDIQNE